MEKNIFKKLKKAFLYLIKTLSIMDGPNIICALKLNKGIAIRNIWFTLNNNFITKIKVNYIQSFRRGLMINKNFD